MASSPPDSALTESLATDIRAFGGQLRRRLRENSEAGEYTPSQIAVITRLHKDGPSTVTQLAHAEGIRPQSMGAIIASLETAGLVVGAADPADRRQTILSLTEACRAWIDAGRAARQDWLMRRIEAELTPKEKAELAVGLDLLKRLIGP